MAKSKSVSYKKTTPTALKAVGILDIEEDGIYLSSEDGYTRKLNALFSDFQGAPVELSISVKDVDDLPDPSEE